MIGINSTWLSNQNMSDSSTVAPITVPRPTAMPGEPEQQHARDRLVEQEHPVPTHQGQFLAQGAHLGLEPGWRGSPRLRIFGLLVIGSSGGL
jgi:hypothetical protein